ncbi:MAG TPA: CHAT domain-containing tetratricopeptide repeat protein [Cyclobacteriaceae bacterium]|nr:CHAT domain-containing tetratricopeptide repeat protein [Cyclobacteriaceae bacterium]
MKFCIPAVFIVVFVAACRQPEPLSVSSLPDLIHGDSINHKFAALNDTRNRGEFKEAAAAYLSFDGTPLEKSYAVLNAAVCNYLRDTTVNYTNTPYIPGLSELVQGISSNSLTLLYRSKRLLDPESFHYLVMLEACGMIHRTIVARMDSALYYFKAAHSLAERHGELAPQMPRTFYHLADMSIIDRDPITGLGYVNEGLQRKPGTHLEGSLLLMKGTLFRKMGHYDSAIKYYDAAGKIIKDRSLVHAERALYSIVTENDTLFFKCIEYINKSVSNRNVNTDRLLGVYYYYKNDLPNSNKHYEKALAYFKSIENPDLVQLMECFFSLTDQYMELGDFRNSEKYAYQSIAYRTNKMGTISWSDLRKPAITNERYSFINYDLLGNTLYTEFKKSGSKKALTQAYQLYQLIDSLIVKQVRVVDDDAILHFVEMEWQMYSRAVGICYDLYDLTKEVTYLEQAHLFIERSKAFLLYKDILSGQDEYFPEIPEEIKRKELELKRKITALKAMNDPSNAELSSELIRLDRFYDGLRNNYPDYYAGRYALQIPSLQTTQLRAKRDSLDILQYFTTRNSIFVISYSDPPLFQKIPLTTALQDSINRFENLVAAPPPLPLRNHPRVFNKNSYYLYTTLFAPLSSGKPNTLIIPDNHIASIPFEALACDTTGSFRTMKYLAKRTNLSYAYSLKTLQPDSIARINPPKNIIAWSFDNVSKNGSLSTLPGTMRELDVIGDVFGNGAKLKSGRSATRKQLMSDLEGEYDVIHLGLHASSSLSNRIDNRMYLPNNEDIFGYEVIPLKIKARTVVLSGCETAAGSYQPGEGTFSLGRSFQQAGVPFVVSSLWSLPDFATSDVMRYFYSDIVQNKSPIKSISSAKVKYLSKSDEITSHPYFWAGLICFR